MWLISEMQDPTEGRPSDSAKNPEDQKIGFDHFCCVKVQVEKVDWLDLDANGHRRAVHNVSDKGWESAWVAP